MIEKVPVFMEGSMASRKLAGAIAGMLSAVGLILGIAAIEPSLFIDAKEVIFTALAGIFGLGGWQVFQQAQIDRVNGKGG